MSYGRIESVGYRIAVAGCRCDTGRSLPGATRVPSDDGARSGVDILGLAEGLPP